MQIDELNEVWNYDPSYHKYCNLLGLNAVKRQDSRMYKRVKAIVDSLGGKTVNQTCERLVKLRQNSGSNELGELLVDRLFYEARLRGDVASEKQQAEKEQRIKDKVLVDKKAEQIEKEAQEKTMQLQKEIEIERARIKELTDLKARVEQVQGGQLYA